MTTSHPIPIELEKGAFTRAGTTIHYWTAGEPDGPTVVCTHGVTIDHGTFDEQIPALVAAGYRAIVWDLRGHGLSRPAGEPISYLNAAADLAMLLDETAVDRATMLPTDKKTAVMGAYPYAAFQYRSAIVINVI